MSHLFTASHRQNEATALGRSGGGAPPGMPPPHSPAPKAKFFTSSGFSGAGGAAYQSGASWAANSSGGGGTTGSMARSSRRVVSGKRQYDDRTKNEVFRAWDPLAAMSVHEVVPFVMGGSLKQTRFHTGFMRRGEGKIDPYRQRRQWEAAVETRRERNEQYRRQQMTELTYRNGRNLLAPSPRWSESGSRSAPATGRGGGFGMQTSYSLGRPNPSVSPYPGFRDVEREPLRPNTGSRVENIAKEGLWVTQRPHSVADNFNTAVRPFDKTLEF